MLRHWPRFRPAMVNRKADCPTGRMASFLRLQIPCASRPDICTVRQQRGPEFMMGVGCYLAGNEEVRAWEYAALTAASGK
jgi:hypothetical protein